MYFVDTHAHLDGEEFREDLPAVIDRARAAGVGKIIIPSISLENVPAVLSLCKDYEGYCYPLVGLQPEEVDEDWEAVLRKMKSYITPEVIGIGECGLDFYWSREHEEAQLKAFEEQVRWSVETRLPLMIHCRKAQNELIAILRKYADDLPGGVFHCFTGNQKEAEAFLQFPRFVLGVGGVSTFKSSHLREDLPAVVPLDRLVLETDCPYMAPVPHRGERNESAFVAHVLTTLAAAYRVSEEQLARQTNENVARVFGLTCE